jgi:hypothetical protein
MNDFIETNILNYEYVSKDLSSCMNQKWLRNKLKLLLILMKI